MRADDHSLTIRRWPVDSIERATGALVDGVLRRNALGLLAKLRRGSIIVVDAGEQWVFGAPGDPLTVTLTVHDPAGYRAMLLGGSVGVGEAYVQGHWTCDDLPKLARILAQNLDLLGAMDRGAPRLVRRVTQRIVAAARRNTRLGSRRNIARHYDLSNELFGLFLDESMTYSSAIFEPAEATLAEAQTAKLRRICAQLALGPDDHLLEIGTGWGGLAIHAARNHGCRVTTTTVSEAQHRLAVERVRASGLEDRIDVLLRDYRDLRGQYDKLVSVEMIEAVGHEYLDQYFRACSDRLAPHGTMLLQAITIADQHHEQHQRSVDFIKEYIFPGSCIPSVTSMVNSATRATDLRLCRLEDLTPHYARTLRCWRERFLDNRAAVRALGFDEEFVRMWDYYLAYCEGGFEERYLGCVHMLFAKPDARAPLAPPGRP